jgi:glycosyl transferase family 25
MLFAALKRSFDAVYVLTIPRAKDRQERVAETLGEGNFEFIFGVDGNGTTKEQLLSEGIYDEEKAREIDRSGRTMTVAEVCCALGHAKIYRKMLAEGHQKVLIFEDDVVRLPFSDAEVDQAVSDMPPDADLIYWGWKGGGYRPWYGRAKQMLYHLQHSLGLLKYDHVMIENLYSRPFNRSFDRAGKHFCAHAYSVNRRAAETLLEMNTPIVLNADNVMLYAVLQDRINAYLCRTPLFDQRSLDPNDPTPSLITVKTTEA